MVIFETVTQAQNNVVFGTKFCVLVSFHFSEKVLRSLQTVYLPLFFFLLAKCLSIRHLAADTGLLPLVTHKCSGQVGLANRSSKCYTRFSAKFSLNCFWALIGEVRLFAQKMIQAFTILMSISLQKAFSTISTFYV